MTDNSQSRGRPWRSVLLPHLAEIRRMRRARHTWIEITKHLREAHEIEVAPPTVYLFFKRAARNNKLPLGFEDPLQTSQPPLSSAGNGGNVGAQAQPARTLPAWFPTKKETSQLTEEDLSFETDPLKLRKAK